jgi:hypothetical protein
MKPRTLKRIPNPFVGAQFREGALPVRRSLWSWVRFLLDSAKSDPRAQRTGLRRGAG